MDQRLAIRSVGHHRKKVVPARVADQEALIPVLAGIADEGSVDLSFPHHLGSAHVAHGFHECRLVPAVSLGTRARRMGRPCGVVRLLAELQKIEHHHRPVRAGVTQCAHLIGCGVDGRIEIRGSGGHGSGAFYCRAVPARTALSTRAGLQRYLATARKLPAVSDGSWPKPSFSSLATPRTPGASRTAPSPAARWRSERLWRPRCGFTCLDRREEARLALGTALPAPRPSRKNKADASSRCLSHRAATHPCVNACSKPP